MDIYTIPTVLLHLETIAFPRPCNLAFCYDCFSLSYLIRICSFWQENSQPSIFLTSNAFRGESWSEQMEGMLDSNCWNIWVADKFQWECQSLWIKFLSEVAWKTRVGWNKACIYYNTEDLEFSQTCHLLMEELLRAKAGWPVLVQWYWEMPFKGTFKYSHLDLMFWKAFLLDK